ncbi:MAG: M28 family peptidase, partial [Bacteroidetes bacterium]|nr:M28 family peptidase [Bacteroidota bacterium]
MKKFLCLFLFLNFSIFNLNAQTNLRFSDAAFVKILEGNYAPSNYYQSSETSAKNAILNELKKNVSSDSLLNYLIALEQFKNRNTGSDTLSVTNGIGAARNWALAKFKSFATANNSPLLSGFFQFDKMICSMTTHKNVVAILPGTDTSAKGFIILEAHLDSRCENACDTACIAQGMEDNGSGVALV